MKYKKKFIKILKYMWIIVLIPLSYLLSFICTSFPQMTEKIYSNGINKAFRQAMSLITGILPFSFIEMIVVIAPIAVIILIVREIAIIVKCDTRKETIKKHFRIIVCFICIFYFTYTVIWTLNYSRISFGDTANLIVKPSSEKELATLCTRLINNANSLRTNLKEDPNGVSKASYSMDVMFNKSANGYSAAAKEYPVLSGAYGKPKKVYNSCLMSYTSIDGVYCPLTCEANIDIDVPKFQIPSIICHEMAHVRGYAKEDECNYISYVVCSMNDDAFVRYSGVTLALIESMNALYNKDYDKFKELVKLYSKGLKRDFEYNYNYWKKHEGSVEKITEKMNDTYLKSNGEKDGVECYGRMVDLLLAEQKKNGIALN